MVAEIFSALTSAAELLGFFRVRFQKREGRARMLGFSGKAL